ncbi:MAG TPA: SRPBCC domain-containing protein [Gemmatimonadaceae bacterium]
MNDATAVSTKSIIVERVLPHPREKIWRALTESALIDEWLMQNDFRPVPGHRFTFQAQPMGDWNGIVDCEVLEVTPPERLRYSWRGGSRTNPVHGTALDSVVTWTLTPVAGGTLVRMVHDGFRPENEMGYQAMSNGWPRVLDRLDRIAARPG